MSDNSPVLDDLGHVTMHLNSFIERMPLAGPVREKIRDKSSHLIKHGDTYALTVFVLDSLAMYGINSNEMLQTIFDIQPSLLSRLQKHQKALPPPELDYLDFYMKKFGKANLDQFLVQAEFEEMLGCDVEKWNLDSWCWVERFEKATLTQVINNARCTNPCVAARISTLNSQRLLVALHNHGKVSDRRTIVSNGVRIKTKVNFGLFHDLDKVQRAFIQPFSQDVPSVYMAGDQLSNTWTKSPSCIRPGAPTSKFTT
ncbi:hypothetical protein BC829DRAFT_506 [Chytridium lagenaria]|nr:hypothetical protein BC829DRAFT_506 [Chytridium lagenaria]